VDEAFAESARLYASFLQSESRTSKFPRVQSDGSKRHGQRNQSSTGSTPQMERFVPRPTVYLQRKYFDMVRAYSMPTPVVHETRRLLLRYLHVYEAKKHGTILVQISDRPNALRFSRTVPGGLETQVWKDNCRDWHVSDMLPVKCLSQNVRVQRLLGMISTCSSPAALEGSVHACMYNARP
jgi:hypothetical protein